MSIGRGADAKVADLTTERTLREYLAAVPLLLAMLMLLFAGVPAASARTIELGTALNNEGFAGGGQR
jgi:hypothetical protein